MTRRAPAFWFDQHPIAWLLFPVSLIFRCIVAIRRLLYRLSVFTTHSSVTPVVVIGNIAVGGTGKTPFLIEACRQLRARGRRPGVVSRGYGAESSVPRSVKVTDDVGSTGDEPMMIASRSACPVIVCRDRVAAVRRLIEEHDVDIVLSDDGLQHYSMGRDFEIAVIDANWMHGNGFCLPAGPLREPESRLKEVDAVVYNNRMDDAICGFQIRAVRVENLGDSSVLPLEDWRGRRVHAVAGIGQPARFFSTLRAYGIDLIEHPFEDHHDFGASDLAFGDDLPVLMTEKDAVKCRSFATSAHWVVEVDVELSQRSIALMDQLAGLTK